MGRSDVRDARAHAADGHPAEVLRDRLTAECLAVAAARAGDADVEVLGFDPHWWDGQSYEACLLISVDGQRARVVETSGEAVVIPFAQRAAAAVLAGRRRPRSPELTVPAPRTVVDHVSLDADGDVTRCPTVSCGALLPVEERAVCPRCGTVRDR